MKIGHFLGEFANGTKTKVIQTAGQSKSAFILQPGIPRGNSVFLPAGQATIACEPKALLSFWAFLQERYMHETN